MATCSTLNVDYRAYKVRYRMKWSLYNLKLIDHSKLRKIQYLISISARKTVS